MLLLLSRQGTIVRHEGDEELEREGKRMTSQKDEEEIRTKDSS
jgi:hypothetical protein